MKKSLFILAIASIAFMGSCKSSKKGAWLDKDKKEFAKSCEAEILKLKDTDNGKIIQSAGVKIEEFAQKSCDCAIKKVEAEYDNPATASKDNSGLTRIGGDCGRDVMKDLMKK